MATESFAFFDLRTGNPQATLQAVDGQLVVRDVANRYVHSFAVRRKSDRAMLRVKDDNAIPPGSEIYVIDAMNSRASLAPGESAYVTVTLRFGQLLMAVQRGEEFVDVE